QLLVALANLRGGPDNITVVVLRVHGAPPEANGAAAHVGAPPPGLFGRLPWPLSTLVAGTLLAAAATCQVSLGLRGALPVYILGARPRGPGPAAWPPPPRRERNGPAGRAAAGPRVHRRSPCGVEGPLLDRLARAARGLRQRAEERHWELDWPAVE